MAETVFRPSDLRGKLPGRLDQLVDRRGFVKAMGMTGFAFVVSPYIPRDPGWDLIPSTMDVARLAFEKLQDARPSQWVFVLHPDLYQEVKDLYNDEILH